METLEEYNLMPDEYEYQGVIVGSYGPYIQSERITIYHAYIKRLIEIGKAYPCFCTRETLDDLRKIKKKRRCVQAIMEDLPNVEILVQKKLSLE